MSKKPSKGNSFYWNFEAKSNNQQLFLDAINNNQIVIATGPAGCGKTLLSSYKALQHYLDRKVRKIILARPAKEACGERIGFIPGSIDEKMFGYSAPFLENLKKLAGSELYNNIVKSGHLEIVPLAFMRGRDFDKCFVVLEEAQNCNFEQFKMVLTRVTDKSKLIISGDTEQNDLGGDQCLYEVADSLVGMRKFKYIELDDSDIVRSKLISEILNRLADINA